MVLRTEQAMVDVYRGDWFVRWPTGELEAMSDAKFRQRFMGKRISADMESCPFDTVLAVLIEAVGQAAFRRRAWWPTSSHPRYLCLVGVSRGVPCGNKPQLAVFAEGQQGLNLYPWLPRSEDLLATDWVPVLEMPHMRGA